MRTPIDQKFEEVNAAKIVEGTHEEANAVHIELTTEQATMKVLLCPHMSLSPLLFPTFSA